jgi:hypothetical protein
VKRGRRRASAASGQAPRTTRRSAMIGMSACLPRAARRHNGCAACIAALRTCGDSPSVPR